MDIQQIQEVLPHRYPFLLVDRILEIELGKRVVGLKNVTINEPFFQGHMRDALDAPDKLDGSDCHAYILFGKPEFLHHFGHVPVDEG